MAGKREGDPVARDPREDLTRDLAERVITVDEPDELAGLDVAADAYFADPVAATDPGGVDEAQGFGIPVGAASVVPIVLFLAHKMIDMATDAGLESGWRYLTARWRGRSHAEPVAIKPLDDGQLAEVRTIFRRTATKWGLSAERADELVALADAQLRKMSATTV
jgi:hypothetical protein